MKPIQFIHMADLHIGSSAYTKFNINAMATLHETVDRANEAQVDVLLLAGDLFDSPPSLQELKRINTILSGFRHKVYMILGNHDRLRPLTRTASFRWAPNIHLFPEGEITSVYDESLNLRIFGMSYDRPQIPVNLYNEYFEIHPVNPKERNILLAHGGDTEHIPTDFAALSEAGLDYCAFGHLHQYHEPAAGIVYSGSLIPQDRTETGPHGYVKGIIDAEGTDFQLVELPARYEALDIDMGKFYNIEELYRELRATLNPDCRYLLRLVGRCDFDLTTDLEQLYHAAAIEKITDDTEPAMDPETLKSYNRNNILGIFIENMQNSPNPLAKKALKFGISAFLEGRDHENQ